MTEKSNDLGYDPTDRNSFPYQKQDPPFGYNDLWFADTTIDNAADLDLDDFLVELTGSNFDGARGYRTIDMALRLFHKAAADPACNDLAFPDLFAACLDQAFIWECG